MHQLDINYIKSSNCRTLTLYDTSIYQVDQPVTNVLLEIRPPNKGCFFIFKLTHPWCSKTFTCIDFDVCCESDTTTCLSDGVYEIKYSVDPNVTTIVETQHLRVYQLMSIYIATISKFFYKKYDLSKADVKRIEEEFIQIKDLIDSAVYAVEEGFDIETGMYLYNKANERINKLNNGNNCLNS